MWFQKLLIFLVLLLNFLLFKQEKGVEEVAGGGGVVDTEGKNMSYII